jgi:alanyl-tRNA synthetase
MQQLVPYLMGEKHPEGKRLVNSQPCIRIQDIEEVGDNRHTTFFEMLGNWSLGEYFKAEQLPWIWEFLTKEIGLPKEKLWVSVFEGTKEVPKDEESFGIWKKLGVPEKKIHYYGAKENWWSRSGTPDQMPVNEIGGPDSEIFFEFTQVVHDPKFGKKCHPNCDCGRFLEIGNSVFIQYIKQKNGMLKELPQKNVDFGGGLERMVAATNDDSDIFKIDLFETSIKKIENISGKSYKDCKGSIRIIADHMRASSKLIAEGVIPNNKLQGYVLRRLIRRSAIKIRELKGDLEKTDLNLDFDKDTSNIIEEEVGKFNNTLNRGLKIVENYQKNQMNELNAFNLFQSYGFPFELTRELFARKGKKLDKKKFDRIFEGHKNMSRTASAGMFKGGMADSSEEVTKLHTTTHLLHSALRKILGESVSQKGSNITSERLRFDFSHPQKLTEEELKKVEALINKQIEKDLSVTFETKTFEKAKEEGALVFFEAKYGEKVKVYSIGPSMDLASSPRASSLRQNSGQAGLPPFSREVCGGPHVARTSEIGHVKIKKQEKIGAGLIRIYAVINLV